MPPEDRFVRPGVAHEGQRVGPTRTACGHRNRSSRSSLTAPSVAPTRRSLVRLAAKALPCAFAAGWRRRSLGRLAEFMLTRRSGRRRRGQEPCALSTFRPQLETPHFWIFRRGVRCNRPEMLLKPTARFICALDYD